MQGKQMLLTILEKPRGKSPLDCFRQRELGLGEGQTEWKGRKTERNLGKLA